MDFNFPPTLPMEVEEDRLEIKIEYFWQPRHCSKCKSFGHTTYGCRAKVTLTWVSRVFVKPTEVINVESAGEEQLQGQAQQLVPAMQAYTEPYHSEDESVANGVLQAGDSDRDVVVGNPSYEDTQEVEHTVHSLRIDINGIGQAIVCVGTEAHHLH